MPIEDAQEMRRWLGRRPLIAISVLAAGLLTVTVLAHEGLAQEAGAPAPASTTTPIEITATPIKHFTRGGLSAEKRFGKLEFRGGLLLSSPAKIFGGLSGIVIEPDGKRFMAVSDETGWLTAEIVYDGGAPSGIRNARMGPIRGIGGRTLDKKRELDAEAITFLDGNLTRGTVLIGFERIHRIAKFPVIDGVLQNPVGNVKLPPEAQRMRQNKGLEAVTVMQGGTYKGSIIAFSERFPDNPAQHTGWLWVKGEPQRLGFPNIGEFDVTDATSLADGTLLILERRFRWTEGVKMRIRRFPADQVKAGALMQGDILIEADLTSEIDNMEGLTWHRSPAGEIILTLISDDNFNHFLQRTLLLQFALIGEGKAAAVKP